MTWVTFKFCTLASDSSSDEEAAVEYHGLKRKARYSFEDTLEEQQSKMPCLGKQQYQDLYICIVMSALISIRLFCL